jgi:hypothetical protein
MLLKRGKKVQLGRFRTTDSRGQVRIPRPSAQAPSDRAWNVPDRSVMLAGHRQLLAAVHHTLRANEPALLCNAEARAGAGATTAILEFAHRHAYDYDIVWWIPAADPELVPIEMAALAEALGLAGTTDDPEVATAQLLRTLQHRDRYLLVFDNAENPRQLARFLPTGHGHLVIISADPDWRAFATAHTVEPFTRAESIALLCTRRPDLSVEAAAQIATILKDLPLAVDPAAGLLADTGTSVELLLKLLSDRTVDHRTRSGGNPNPIAAMWAVAFDHLAADDPATLALLTLLAWLGPEPVPLRLITEHPHELPESLADTARNPTVLAERTTGLRRRGLVQITPDSVALHRIPAALLLARTDHEHPEDAAGGWVAAAVRLLRAAVPENPSDPTSWATWKQLLPLVLSATNPGRRLDDATADAGWLLHQAATYLDVRGQARAAEALHRDADDLSAARGGRLYREPFLEPAASICTGA